MALDIEPGHYLSVDGTDYPIRDCGAWVWPYPARGLKRMLRVTASTKRSTLTAGKWGEIETYLTDLRCTPLDPVTLGQANSIRIRLGLSSPAYILQTFVDGGDTFYHLILEKIV